MNPRRTSLRRMVLTFSVPTFTNFHLHMHLDVMMLEALDRSYISKHRLSIRILSSVCKASLTSLGCAAISAL
eukprot:5742092-Pyramimonas_sp.AAC.1